MSSAEENEDPDILELNKQQQQAAPKTEQVQQQEPPAKEEIDLDNVLNNQQESAKNFDPSAFKGYDLDRWTNVFGTIADQNTQIQVALSTLDTYKIPWNKSNDYIYPEWQILELRYYSVTQGALDRRQSLNARVEDLNRTGQVINLRIQEMQQEIQERKARQMRGGGSNDLAIQRSNKVTLDNARVEDLQRNIKALEEIPNDISSDIQRSKTDANWLGFQMYFHIKDKDVFDNVRADHLDNILKACDLKQLGVPKNQGTSSNSPMQVRQGVH